MPTNPAVPVPGQPAGPSQGQTAGSRKRAPSSDPRAAASKCRNPKRSLWERGRRLKRRGRARSRLCLQQHIGKGTCAHHGNFPNLKACADKQIDPPAQSAKSEDRAASSPQAPNRCVHPAAPSEAYATRGVANAHKQHPIRTQCRMGAVNQRFLKPWLQIVEYIEYQDCIAVRERGGAQIRALYLRQLAQRTLGALNLMYINLDPSYGNRRRRDGPLRWPESSKVALICCVQPRCHEPLAATQIEQSRRIRQ